CCISVLVDVDPPRAEACTLSLRDALPICARGHRLRIARCPLGGGLRPNVASEARRRGRGHLPARLAAGGRGPGPDHQPRDEQVGDRKSTRLNSSHVSISYAVFCLKKKNSS